jgi:hypothetical protein
MVAYGGLPLAAGSSDKAAHQGKSKGLAEREGWRKERRLFFGTTEATILLKIKDEVFANTKNELTSRPKLAPKCTPKPRFFPIPDLICAPKGPNYGRLIDQRYEIPKAAHVYYVAPDGNAGWAGTTLEQPTTLEAAIERVVIGDAIVMRGGVYRTGGLVLNQGITLFSYIRAQRAPLPHAHPVSSHLPTVGGECTPSRAVAGTVVMEAGPGLEFLARPNVAD